MMPQISAKKLSLKIKSGTHYSTFQAEQIAFARVLTDGDDNLNDYVQAKNQAQQAYALVEAGINKIENENKQHGKDLRKTYIPKSLFFYKKMMTEIKMSV